MASLNKVELIGNLGADPETRYFPDGTAKASISLATTDFWKDKTTGEKKERTEWHRVVYSGKLAEIVGEHLKKGSQIYTAGRLRTRPWTDSEGVERHITEIIGLEMQMLGKKPAGNEAPAKAQTPPPMPKLDDPDLDDDLPPY